MIENTIADKANYNMMLDEIKSTLGEDALMVTICLSQGMSKRAAAKYLKMPYPKVKDIVKKIAAIIETTRAGK